MNAVLREILGTGQVRDGEERLRLHSHMGEEEGALIHQLFTTVKPATSIEIGFAYGISTLYACDALSENGRPCRHIVIDPAQSGHWQGIGLKNVALAGFDHLVEFHEDQSAIVLPALFAGGTRVQAAIIDGLHTFDQPMMDFFFINKMLDVGGVVILDDANWPGVLRLVKHISTYPAYRIRGRTGPAPIRIRARVRRALAPIIPPLRRDWDRILLSGSRCVAFEKVAEDRRPFEWHVDF
jgi:predicted O-methyltransferase YrrM